MGKNYNRHMHTAEHVLNKTMVETFGCGRAFSAHINSKKSKCDYKFERPLSDDEAAGVESAVNEALARGLQVVVEFLPLENAQKEYDLGRLPDDAGDTVRIVHVGDYDSCPCIGEHVGNTSEIGTFRLTTHSFSDGVLRIRFKLATPE